MDIENVFLNGDLEEEVCIEIPSGLETETNINKACRLKNKILIWSQAISSILVWSFHQGHKEVWLL